MSSGKYVISYVVIFVWSCSLHLWLSSFRWRWLNVVILEMCLWTDTAYKQYSYSFDVSQLYIETHRESKTDFRVSDFTVNTRYVWIVMHAVDNYLKQAHHAPVSSDRSVIKQYPSIQCACSIIHTGIFAALISTCEWSDRGAGVWLTQHTKASCVSVSSCIFTVLYFIPKRKSFRCCAIATQPHLRIISWRTHDWL